MKWYGALLLLLWSAACTTSGKKITYIQECEELILDLSDGTFNGVKPTTSQTEITDWIPCHTRVIPDGASTHCGGAILYEKHDFYFYTYLDNYIEIRERFSGKVSDNVWRQSREAIIMKLGTPVESKAPSSDSQVDLFPAEYGCIRIHYKNNEASVIAIHYADCREIEWCQDNFPE